MIVKKVILISLLSFVFVLNVLSQSMIKTLDNKTFTSKIGSLCEETSGDSPCAGQEIYLSLKFNEMKVAITEVYVSSCDEESLSYKLEYKWELINDSVIKIHYKPEEVKYRSIENMKIIVIEGVLFGYNTDSNNKTVEYNFKCIE